MNICVQWTSKFYFMFYIYKDLGGWVDIENLTCDRIHNKEAHEVESVQEQWCGL